MSRTKRVLATAVVVLSGLVACASPITPSPAACGGDEQCLAGARCTASTCVTNSPPTADFTVTGILEANAEITLDASSSSDSDERDSIVEYAWTITKTSGDCVAPTVSDKTRTVTLRFSCAGEYQISLSVTDEMHATSAPSKKPLVVAARTGPVLVEVGPDQAVDHVCGGYPLTCLPADAEGRATAIQLWATPKNPAYPNVRWKVIPPEGREIGSGTGRTVTFQPSANVSDPTVVISTNGAAISGDWEFRAEIVDGENVLDAAVTRVSIGNRAPTIVGHLPDAGFPHQYESGIFRANGVFPVQLEDPDGDPIVEHGVTPNQTEGMAARFEVLWTPANASAGTPDSVAISVLASSSAELIADAIERTVTVEATDANGASTSETFQIVIGNQPPERNPSVQAETSAQHGFDTAAYQFTSTPRLGQWTDPDGDPLFYDVEADADCIEFQPSLDDQGALRLDCRAGGSLSDFIRGDRTASVKVSDPWKTLSPSIISFGISNRKPNFKPTPLLKIGISCSMGGGPVTCASGPISYPSNVFSAINLLTSTGVSDPDGDPLVLLPSANAELTSCAPNTASCPLTLKIPAEYTCSPSPSTRTISFTATDGVGSTSASLTVEPFCR